MAWAKVDSPVSNGGRGLKLALKCDGVIDDGFARQQWRAWIETLCPTAPGGGAKGFARQQWRAWIAMLQRRCGRKPSMGA